MARLGPPGIWCHGLAIRPGKPTLLAECAGVPVIGLPGNPRSALVVFRLLGDAAGAPGRRVHRAAAEPVVRARLARDLASAAGRLDVVQVRLEDGLAVPLFGLSALLSVLTAADGYVVVPEEATGLDAGTDVDVTVVPLTTIMTGSPFLRDVPAARALDAWRAAREAGGCPARLPAHRVPLEQATGRVTAEPVWATRSSPPFDAAGMDGIAVRAADTLGASETTPVLPGAGRLRRGGHRRPDARRPGRRGHARARALRRRHRRTARGRAALPACAVDRRGRQHRRAAAARGAPAAGGGRGRRGRGRRHANCSSAAGRW